MKDIEINRQKLSALEQIITEPSVDLDFYRTTYKTPNANGYKQGVQKFRRMSLASERLLNIFTGDRLVQLAGGLGTKSIMPDGMKMKAKMIVCMLIDQQLNDDFVLNEGRTTRDFSGGGISYSEAQNSFSNPYDMTFEGVRAQIRSSGIMEYLQALEIEQRNAGVIFNSDAYLKIEDYSSPKVYDENFVKNENGAYGTNIQMDNSLIADEIEALNLTGLPEGVKGDGTTRDSLNFINSKLKSGADLVVDKVTGLTDPNDADNKIIELDESEFTVTPDNKIGIKAGSGNFGDGTSTTTQATKAETLISEFAEVKDGELDLFAIDKTTGFKYTTSISKDGITSDNDVIAPGKVISDVHQSLTNPASYEGYVVDPINGVIKESNGIAQHNFENVFVDENVETSSLTLNNSEAKKVVEIDEDFTEDKTQLHLPTTEKVKDLILEKLGGVSTNDKQIELTASFGTDNIEPKDLRSFLDWFALHINGGKNDTNKMGIYFNDNGNIEITYDKNPIMIIENGKVNFLNQGTALIGDSNDPLSALNASQIKTLVDQLIASANLTEDKVNYVNNTISVNTDANTNQYITYTPVGVNYFDRAGDTSEFITCGPDNFVASDIQTNMLGFELLFGGEFFNKQLGLSGQGNAWSEYLTIPTIALNKSVDYQVVHNIKGKKTNGEFFVKTKIELDMRYVLVNVDNKYQLEFGEFVNYSLITYNENGTINKTQSGTHYLNDSDYTYDKQPLRLELGGTGYTTIGSGSVDLTDYYTKAETDTKLADKVDKNVNEIAIGINAGKGSQGERAIAIGGNAGETLQGANAIAIGHNAGNSAQKPESIHIRATRADTYSGLEIPSTNEIVMRAGNTVFKVASDGLYINGKKVSV